MASIEVLGTGVIDRRDSAFPTVVRLANSSLMAAFNVGGGPYVYGGTDWALSTDGGESWTPGGTILPPDPETGASNTLRLSRTANDELLAWGQRMIWETPGVFGKFRSEPVLCRSRDGGRTWTGPDEVPSDYPGSWEISAPILVLQDGTFLAPGATLPSEDRLGEQVLVMRSQDGGRTWQTRLAMQDPNGRNGYLEQKLTELQPGRVMMTAWTVTLGDAVDQENHFAVSADGGSSWSEPRSTGILGQTMTPVYLGGNRLLVLYNKRDGNPGIRMCLVRFTDKAWQVEFEGSMYGGRSALEGRPADRETGVERFSDFQFGYPTAVRLSENEFLATHWCKEDGPFQVRWTRLRMNL